MTTSNGPVYVVVLTKRPGVVWFYRETNGRASLQRGAGQAGLAGGDLGMDNCDASTSPDKLIL